MIYNDNLRAVLQTVSGGSFHRNSHYRFKLNFIRDLIKRNLIQVNHKSGSEMVADVLTKPLPLSIPENLFVYMRFGRLEKVLELKKN